MVSKRHWQCKQERSVETLISIYLTCFRLGGGSLIPKLLGVSRNQSLILYLSQRPSL